MYDYTDFSRGTWTVVVSWGIGGIGGQELGRATLKIKSNGTITEELAAISNVTAQTT